MATKKTMKKPGRGAAKHRRARLLKAMRLTRRSRPPAFAVETSGPQTPQGMVVSGALMTVALQTSEHVDFRDVGRARRKAKPSGEFDIELIRFLLGEGGLDGRWFGDPSTPAFWWRPRLRKLLEHLRRLEVGRG